MKSVDDKYGYDEREVKRSYIIPTAFAIMALAVSISAFLGLLPATQGADEQVLAQGLDKLVSLATKDVVDLSFSQSHVLSSLVLVSGFIISIVMLRYAREDNDAFMDAYHHIDDFYSSEQKEAAHKHALIFICISLPFLIVSIVGIIANVSSNSMVLRGISFFLLSIGLWLLLHGVIWGRRVDVFAYNFKALDRISIYELRSDDSIKDRDLMIHEKKLRVPMRTAKRVVVVVGVIVALCLYFLPSLQTPYYWVAIVVALLVVWAIGLYSEKRIKASLR